MSPAVKNTRGRGFFMKNDLREEEEKREFMLRRLLHCLHRPGVGFQLFHETFFEGLDSICLFDRDFIPQRQSDHRHISHDPIRPLEASREEIHQPHMRLRALCPGEVQHALALFPQVQVMDAPRQLFRLHDLSEQHRLRMSDPSTRIAHLPFGFGGPFAPLATSLIKNGDSPNSRENDDELDGVTELFEF